MKKLRLLSRFVLLIGIISFSGCGKLPVKPEIESGIIISEENIIFYVNNQTSEEREVEVCMADGSINPLLNKEITHTNKDWNKVLLYIRLLENKVSKKVKRELKKYRVNFDRLGTKIDGL